MTELEKYQGIYSSPDYAAYGHSNHGQSALQWLLDQSPKSVLDVGCGHNEFIQTLRAHLPAETRLTGVDFACPNADVQASLTQLPFPDKSFDVITAFDVLEHLLPHEVPIALREMARVASRFCVSICYRASYQLWRGQNLHPTVQPEDWWINQLHQAGSSPVQKHKQYLTGSFPPPRASPQDHPWHQLANLHAGRPALVIGKGPSLDAWLAAGSPKPEEAIVLGVGHTCALTPCHYGVTNHAEQTSLAEISTQWVVSLPHLMRYNAWEPECMAKPDWAAHWFACVVGWHSLEQTREQITDLHSLWNQSSSAHPAIHLAWYLGCTSLLCVGLDGGHGYAQSMQPTATNPVNPNGYFGQRRDTNQGATTLFGDRWSHWGQP